ncbi:MAG TPA: VTT domain-containing protein [Vicinamibacterales bacterium]|nr:VTT domain-containing protein [Vicinamibacterales bacterium]
MALDWLAAHASIVLFVNLSCGIAGLPLLSETLLLISGAMVARGDRSFVVPFLAAVAGCVIGMTTSFAIGRAGQPFARRCASFFGMRDDRFTALMARCRRLARVTIVCAYFTPGMRHLTAITAGVSDVRTDVFVPSAMAGACAWSALLLWTGMAAGTPAAAMSLSAAWYVPVAWAIAIAAAAWTLRATGVATPSRP